MGSIDSLHVAIRACTLCQDAGFIERAAPVVAGHVENRMMLIGQAPGITEQVVRRPFHGRAGRELFRWMAEIGIGEEEFRAQVYMTAITKCFPGKSRGGKGDRKPSPREIALCRPFLDAQLGAIRPQSILLVGALAIERWFPRIPLTELIGCRFEREAVRFIPLPHPSGASRWLNRPEHRDLLRQALQLVRCEWVSLQETAGRESRDSTVSAI